jgi:HtrA serine peptidase 2
MKVTPGISFAIPIDYAKQFLEKAEKVVRETRSTYGEQKRRKYMGITMLSLTKEIIEELKQRGSTIPSSIDSGILVYKVVEGSPAHSSGLQAADIILNINKIDVKNTQDIYSILESNTKSLEMIVLRNGAIVRVVVTPENPE